MSDTVYHTTTLRLDIPRDALDLVLAECSIQRTEFAHYVHNAIDGAAPWMPIVHCAGIHYVVIISNITTLGAAAILHALAAHEAKNA